jgi:hypothetical protein
MRRAAVVFLAALLLIVLVAGVARWLSQPAVTSPPVPEPPVDDPTPAPLVTLPDLSGLDRSLIEPTYRGNPQYCLLVFGPRAETRVWLVEDGDTLYIDRNANGDLTEAGEAVPVSDHREETTVTEQGTEVPYRAWTFAAGDLTAQGHQLEVLRFQTGDEPAQRKVSVQVNGAVVQYAGWARLFQESRAKAPVVHFGGPVVPRALRGGTFHLGQQGEELHFCLGTPGLGEHSFAYLAYEAVPPTVRPVLDIAWPTAGLPLEDHVTLTHRC